MRPNIDPKSTKTNPKAHISKRQKQQGISTSPATRHTHETWLSLQRTSDVTNRGPNRKAISASKNDPRLTDRPTKMAWKSDANDGTEQPINEPTNPPIHRPTNQSTHQPTNRPTNRPDNPSINPINQCLITPIGETTHINQTNEWTNLILRRIYVLFDSFCSFVYCIYIMRYLR